MLEPVPCQKTYVTKGGKTIGGCGKQPKIFEIGGIWYVACDCMNGQDTFACAGLRKQTAIEQWNEMQDLTKIYKNKGAKIEYTRTGKRNEKRARKNTKDMQGNNI